MEIPIIDMVPGGLRQARLRVSVTAALGAEDWFRRQVAALRSAGVHYDPGSRTWFRWLDLAEPETAAEVLTAVAAVAAEFGAAVLVEAVTPPPTREAPIPQP